MASLPAATFHTVLMAKAIAVLKGKHFICNYALRFLKLLSLSHELYFGCWLAHMWLVQCLRQCVYV
eukprot:scaffold245666_cov22-Prasinocladus_malaysianus.AAC.1